MNRRPFPAKVMVAAFERAADHCEKCSARLAVGKFHYDHVIPDAMGGEPVLSNCAVLCLACHSTKTRTKDVPAIAKVKRVKAKHIGAKKPSSFRKAPPGMEYDWKRGRYVRAGERA